MRIGVTLSSRRSTPRRSSPACSPARRARRRPRPRLAPPPRSLRQASARAGARPRPAQSRARPARAPSREVDVGIADALADPLVLDRPVAHARDALLVHFVVVERAIVGDHDQQRNAVMRRRPERGRAHQEIAVAADADRHAAGAVQRQRRADRDAGAGAEPAAAVRAEKIERMAERPPRAVPRQRQMRERDGPFADGVAQRAREMFDGERSPADSAWRSFGALAGGRAYGFAERLHQQRNRVRPDRRRAAGRPARGPDGPCSSRCAPDSRPRRG